MKRRFRFQFLVGRIGPVVGVLALLSVAVGCARSTDEIDLPPRLIAHAGGIGNQRTDTNSLEALDASVSRGHTVIEVDLSWTTDVHLVLLHDWEKTLSGLFDGATGAMTLAEFGSLESLNGLSHLSLDDLVGWLEDTPEILIVTDIKARNIDGLRLISEKYPDLRSRFVPQIFAPESIVEVRRLGFDRVIFSLYRSDLPDNRIVEFALESRPWAVTIPVRRAVEGNLPEELSVRGVRVFAHTVNDYQRWTDSEKRGSTASTPIGFRPLIEIILARSPNGRNRPRERSGSTAGSSRSSRGAWIAWRRPWNCGARVSSQSMFS